jgi:hypothetical protein
MRIRVTYFTNNGTERFFERDTTEQAITEYYNRRQHGACWGFYWRHGVVNGDKVYIL